MSETERERERERERQTDRQIDRQTDRQREREREREREQVILTKKKNSPEESKCREKLTEFLENT